MTGRWQAADAARSLHVPGADDDKYTRGVVGVRTGSDAYPGAAVLGVEAAWRAGTGMVRYLGPSRAADLVLARRPETVTAPGRVQAWVIGSGTDAGTRTLAETAELAHLLDGPDPVVVDAGALDLAPGARAPRVVTPHAREHDRLRRLLGLPPVEDVADVRADAAAETAAVLGAVVLLKGAVTLVADPGGDVRQVTTGTGWLATAGTGDVLAGCLGAVVAGVVAHAASVPSPVALADAAATAAWLHGTAAR
ncbi:MAG: NAD(P)H-hydrate dehydratase, partial [Microbacterium sp.]|uniref:ADP-dependent NAD(P)H-hydrate dehydratase n=1 Tax=Microbacterium sp. TaxID=51671 RepID=UPI0039E2D88C